MACNNPNCKCVTPCANCSCGSEESIMEKKLKVTPARCVFIRMLMSGPKTWKDLREAYYGPERAKSKSSTSFQNQIEKQLVLGIIQHVDGHYELTAKGVELSKLVDDEKLVQAKSIAQTKYEAGA